MYLSEKKKLQNNDIIITQVYPFICPEKNSEAIFKNTYGTSLVVQWLRLCAPNAGGPGSIPVRGTRSHMLQLRVYMPQLKIPCAATKDPACSNEDPTRGNKDLA